MATKALKGSGGLSVNVVTPTGPVAAAETDAVVAPGQLGEFEILVGHIPFLSELHAGVLMLGENQTRHVFAVGPGFLEVSATGAVQVLVERALAVADIDVAAAKSDLAEAGELLKAWDGELDAEHEKLRIRQAWGQAQLDARARVS